MQNINSTAATPAPKALNYGLWTVQILLGATFVMAGGMKMTAPVEELAQQMPWVGGAMGGLVRFIGLAEVLGAIGLILPAATRILPRLTTYAAAGLTTVMVLASVTHLSRGELGAIGVNAVLGAMAAFVVWGRAKGAPIAAR